ncbi:hypothetical protein [Paenibacillus sp. OV219]|uniref:hypothetical protein n=1 Tax=Paenibacillus sp. OV219 TaxID=1884377 RepID=UPI0008ABA9FC|nr:hypothetical protein [Paenibacillus sp. OV219]SEM92832.1 hypothetical protein SAMN05518847_1011170 [Paenibacillus sp. OV219]
MSDDLYFGHGIGIKNADGIIAALSRHRVLGESQNALVDIRPYCNNAGRPNPITVSDHRNAEIFLALIGL